MDTHVSYYLQHAEHDHSLVPIDSSLIDPIMLESKEALRNQDMKLVHFISVFE